MTYIMQCCTRSTLTTRQLFNCDVLLQQLSKSADDVSDIVEVEAMAGMTEDEKARARYVHKRRSVSCILVNKWTWK